MEEKWKDMVIYLNSEFARTGTTMTVSGFVSAFKSLCSTWKLFIPVFFAKQKLANAVCSAFVNVICRGIAITLIPWWHQNL